MLKKIDNIYFQCLLFTLLWQLVLFVLYIANLITYNPLIELSDILPNFFFILFLSLVFLSPLFAFFIILIIYICGVILYFYTRQNLTLGQISNLPELILIFSPISFLIIILLIIFIYFLLKFSRSVNFVKLNSKLRFFQIGICLFLLSILYFSTKIYFPIIAKHNTENFNKFATWKHGGQLYSIIYHFAERKNMMMTLDKISGEVTPQLNFTDKPKSDLIMIVLLESFVPRSDIEPKNFKPFLNDLGYKSIILESPAYGGYSAASEFEILCGVPELQPLGDMSFNYFGGKNIKFCLPSLLSEYNFQTISITGTKSHFHNAKNAYPTLGFEKNISKDDLINDDFDGIHPSDESMFERAYNEILVRKKDNLFLYLFTAAGHSPYELNPIKRPRLSDDKYFDRISYTEEELKEFLKKINLLELEISIIIASDHAARSSKLNRNRKLLNVWYKSNVLDDFNKNCSQYFEISKFFTGQNCNIIKKNNNEIIGRSVNFPFYNENKSLILKLIKNSQK